MRKIQIIGILLIAVLLLVGACYPTEPVPATPAPSEESTPSSEPVIMPTPSTAQEAIAIVRASPDMSTAVAPYKQELDWKAEWVKDRWWVIGLFESPWGVKFVSDATIWDGRVYAYINYGQRPKREWVEARAKEWGLSTYYTRLTPDEALSRVKKSDSVRYALQDVKVIDGVAELVEDNSIFQAWRFAFYVLRTDGNYALLVADGLGGKGAEEGNYVSEYGFGNATESYWEIPLHLVDWVRSLAKSRGWQNVVNLPQ
jgi:hypothetical protein